MPTTTYSDSTFSVAAIGNRTDSAGVAVSDYTAEETRFVTQLFTEGYLTPTTAFKVNAQAVPDMTVEVGSGTAKADYYIIAGEAGGQGNYIVRLDVTSLTVTVPAADASQTRTDEIYLVVRDNAYDASSRGLPQIGYRKGDVGGTNPGVDSTWKASALLARVTVAAAATTITAGAISDQRVAAGLSPVLASHVHAGTDITSGTIPAARIPSTLTGLTVSGTLTAGALNMGGTYLTDDTIYVGDIDSDYSIDARPFSASKLDPGLTFGQSISCTTIYTGASLGAINGATDRSSAWFGLDNTGPYIRFYWNGSNIQFVRTDTNAVVKTFVIDHPDDPSKYLVHATTESPHNGVEYWGEATIKNGRAVVDLPSYFESLCAETNRQVQVSVILPDRDGSRLAGNDVEETVEVPVPVVAEDRAGRKRPDGSKTRQVKRVRPGRPAVPENLQLPVAAASVPRGGRFRIACSGPDGTRVAWLVKAVRKDVSALNAEPLKADNDLHGDGPYTYLTPRAK